MIVWTVESFTEREKYDGGEGGGRKLFCIASSKEEAFKCCAESGFNRNESGWHWLFTPWTLNKEEGHGESEHWLTDLSDRCDEDGHDEEMSKIRRELDIKEYNILKKRLGKI